MEELLRQAQLVTSEPRATSSHQDGGEGLLQSEAQKSRNYLRLLAARATGSGVSNLLDPPELFKTVENKLMEQETQLFEYQEKLQSLNIKVQLHGTEAASWKRKEQDLLSELKSYKELNAELLTHAGDLEAEIESLKSEVRKLKSENKQTQSTITNLTEQNIELERDISILKRENEHLKGREQTLKKDVNELRNDVEMKKADLAEVTLEKEFLSKQIDDQKAKIKELIEKNISLTSANAVLTEQSDSFEKAVEDLKEKLEERDKLSKKHQDDARRQRELASKFEADLELLEVEKKRSEQEIYATNQKNQLLEKQITQLQSEIEALTLTNEDLEKQILKLKQRPAESSVDSKTSQYLEMKEVYEKRLQDKSSEAKKLTQEINVLREENQRLNSNLQEAKTQLQDLLQDKNDLEQQIQNDLQQTNQIKELLQNLEVEYENLKIDYQKLFEEKAEVERELTASKGDLSSRIQEGKQTIIDLELEYENLKADYQRLFDEKQSFDALKEEFEKLKTENLQIIEENQMLTQVKEEYEDLKSDYQNLFIENQALKVDFEQLKANPAEIQEETHSHNALKQEYENLSSDYMKLFDERNHILDAYKQLEEEVAALRERLDQSPDNIENQDEYLRIRINELEEENHALCEKNKQLEEEVQSLGEKYQLEVSELENLRTSSAVLMKQLEELRRDHTEELGEYNEREVDLKHQVEERNKLIELLKQKLQATEEKLVNNESVITDLTQKIDQLEKGNNSQKGQIQALMDRIAEQHHDDSSGELKEGPAKSQVELLAQISDISIELDKAKRVIDSQRQEIEDLVKATQALEDQKKILTAQISEFEKKYQIALNEIKEKDVLIKHYTQEKDPDSPGTKPSAFSSDTALLQRENLRLSTENKKLQEMHSNSLQLIQERNENIHEKAKVINEQEEEINRLREFISKYTEQIQTLQDQLESQTEKENQYKHEIEEQKRDFEKKLNEFKQSNSDKKGNIDGMKLQTQVAQLEQINKDKEEELATLRGEVKENEKHLQVMSDSLKSRVTAYEEKITMLREDYEKQIVTLKEEHENLFDQIKVQILSVLEDQRIKLGPELSMENPNFVQEGINVLRGIIEDLRKGVSKQDVNFTIQQLEEELEDERINFKMFEEFIRNSLYEILNDGVVKKRVLVIQPHSENYIEQAFTTLQSVIGILGAEVEKLNQDDRRHSEEEKDRSRESSNQGIPRETDPTIVSVVKVIEYRLQDLIKKYFTEGFLPEEIAFEAEGLEDHLQKIILQVKFVEENLERMNFMPSNSFK